MLPLLYFYLNSSDSEEEGDIVQERIIRRKIRDSSNPLSLPQSAFLKRYRLSKEAFTYVLSELSFEGHMSTHVPPMLQLAVTLTLLASGSYQHSVGNDYWLGLCQSGVSKVTSRVLKEMERKLCPKMIGFTQATMESCKELFMTKYKIPGVIGCVDGTHIGLQKPTKNEHMFFNRKGYHSLNSLIICDHEYRITAKDSKYGGAAHDSFVWKHSDQRMDLEQRFNNNTLKNSWLLGDSGYPLEPWCITTYRNAIEGSSEAKFNEVHSKARCIVERTIGILKSRWRILCYEKRGRYNPEKVALFANCCGALHNIGIKFKIPYHIQDSEMGTDTSEFYIGEETQITKIGEKIRNNIKVSLCNIGE